MGDALVGAACRTKVLSECKAVMRQFCQEADVLLGLELLEVEFGGGRQMDRRLEVVLLVELKL